MLDLRRLEMLVTVARAGSLTAAAEELGVTQPAIGQQLRTLEAECGVSLVVRAGRSVQLTAAGSALVSRAMPILAAIVDVEKELEAIQRGVTGAVTVAATSCAFRPLVAPALRALHGRVEDLRVGLVEIGTESAASLLEPLLSGDCDIAIVPDGASGVDQPDLHHALLADFACVVVVPQEHELARLTTVPWSRFAHGPVLTTTDVSAALPLQFLRNATGWVTALSATDAVVELTSAWAGVALLPEVLLELPAAAQLAVRPLEDDVRLRYLAVTRRHFEPTPAMRAILEALAMVHPVSDEVSPGTASDPI